MPTIQLTEGMLTMFIKSDASKQMVRFGHRESLASQFFDRKSMLKNNGAILDLGSLKETIMIEPEESKTSIIQGLSKN